jgi:acetyl esterase/lipase
MKPLKKILGAVGILVAALALYVAVVAIGPGFEVSPQPLQRPGAWHERAAPSPQRSQRANGRIEVEGTSLSAWLFLPREASAPVPCIVMAHGFGGTKDMGLETYAIRFQEAGYAALVFDYRTFGESGGEPRQLLRPESQLEDYAAAVEFARGLDEVDPTRIVLWGTSYSGGHVIVAAARDRRIACVIAQAPGLDGRATGKAILDREGWGFMLRMLLHAQRDRFRSWLGLSPHRIPIVGPPGSIACLNTPDAMGAFAALATDRFRNEACARIWLEGGEYRPV